MSARMLKTTKCKLNNKIIPLNTSPAANVIIVDIIRNTKFAHIINLIITPANLRKTTVHIYPKATPIIPQTNTMTYPDVDDDEPTEELPNDATVYFDTDYICIW